MKTSGITPTPTKLLEIIQWISQRVRDLETQVAKASSDATSVIIVGAGNPNGVVTAIGPKIYIDNTDPLVPIIYTKSTLGTSNTDWV